LLPITPSEQWRGNNTFVLLTISWHFTSENASFVATTYARPASPPADGISAEEKAHGQKGLVVDRDIAAHVGNIPSKGYEQ